MVSDEDEDEEKSECCSCVTALSSSKTLCFLVSMDSRL